MRTEIDRYLRQWSLAPDGQIIETPSSWILPVRRLETPAILKLLKPTSDEQNAADLLTYYDGMGAVHLFEADAKALLMERCGRDSEAAVVLANTMATLHEPRGRKAPSSLIPLAARFSSLFDHQDDNGLLGRCADVARKLLATEKDKIPLHGDLHHGNVLDGGHRGWLAIDPKALIGERTYDVANLLRNPSPHGNLVHSPDRMRRLAHFYASRLALDAPRILKFALAHAGLSLSWDIEDGEVPNYSLECAELLSSLVDG